MGDESEVETKIPQDSIDLCGDADTEVAEKGRLLIEESFVPYEKFPERAKLIIDRIDRARIRGWENAEKDNFKAIEKKWGGQFEVDLIPNLDEVIQNTLEEVVRDEYPDFINRPDDGFLSLRGTEWVTREMALDEYARLSRLKNKGKKVENVISTLTVGNSQMLDEVRNILARSIYLSHATSRTSSALDHGTVVSRKQFAETTGTTLQAASYSNLKTTDQEMEQVSFGLDNIALRYGSLGNLEGMRGVFLFDGLEILLNENTSFFSADGLHVFRQNGTSFGLENAVLLTTKSDYEKGIHGEHKHKFFSDDIEHVEILSGEGKKRLKKLILRNEIGEPVFLSESIFENSRRLPAEISQQIERRFVHSTSEELRNKVKKSSYIIPTGEFGDGPGAKTKIFRRQIVVLE